MTVGAGRHDHLIFLTRSRTAVYSTNEPRRSRDARDASMTNSQLRALLTDAITRERSHPERIALAAAVISAALREGGMQATLVGGGAIEYHAGQIYTTSDIDLVVEGKSRAELDAALTGLGFQRRGRHWVYEDIFVEVPGNWMPDPVDEVMVGTLPLRVVKREVVLADRIIGFKHWRTTAYGAQAIALLQLFGDRLDDALLRERLRAEDAEDALDALQRMANEDTPISEDQLQALLRGR